VVAVGELAPEFELPGVCGRTGEFRSWSLSEFRGQPVVLVFYPGDNSPVCRRQLQEYTEGIAQFDELNAQVLALSPQAPKSHKSFSERSGGFGFPLLSDVRKDVARTFGVLGLLDLYRRCIFVLDGDGTVQYSHRYVGPGLGYRPLTELIGAVEKIGSSTA